MFRRMLFLLPVLGVVLVTAFSSVRADEVPEGVAGELDHMVQQDRSMNSSQLSKIDMERLKGGQGCFGLAGFWVDNDPTCCSFTKRVASSSEYYFFTAPIAILSAIYNIGYC